MYRSYYTSPSFIFFLPLSLFLHLPYTCPPCIHPVYFLPPTFSFLSSLATPPPPPPPTQVFFLWVIRSRSRSEGGGGAGSVQRND